MQAGEIAHDIIGSALVERRHDAVPDHDGIRRGRSLLLGVVQAGRLRRKTGEVAGNIIDRAPVEILRLCLHRRKIPRFGLVSFQRAGEVSSILTREVREFGIVADALIAVTSGAALTDLLAGRRIADGRRLTPGRGLPRIVQCNPVELCLIHTREHRLHHVVLAPAADVSLHGPDKRLWRLPGKIWNSGSLADPALAVTPRAGDRLAARSVLIFLDRTGEVLRILTCEARPCGIDADALLAVAPGAQSTGGLSAHGIADRPGLRPNPDPRAMRKG